MRAHVLCTALLLCACEPELPDAPLVEPEAPFCDEAGWTAAARAVHARGDDAVVGLVVDTYLRFDDAISGEVERVPADLWEAQLQDDGRWVAEVAAADTVLECGSELTYELVFVAEDEEGDQGLRSWVLTGLDAQDGAR